MNIFKTKIKTILITVVLTLACTAPKTFCAAMAEASSDEQRSKQQRVGYYHLMSTMIHDNEHAVASILETYGLSIDQQFVYDDCAEDEQITPLSYAIRSGKEETAKMLIDKGANLNIDCDGLPLFHAVKGQHGALASILLDSGKLDLSLKGHNPILLLQKAFENDDAPTAKLLIERFGIDVHSLSFGEGEQSEPALIFAINHRLRFFEDAPANIVPMLIGMGVDANRRDVANKSPLYHAAALPNKIMLANIMLHAEPLTEDEIHSLEQDKQVIYRNAQQVMAESIIINEMCICLGNDSNTAILEENKKVLKQKKSHYESLGEDKRALVMYCDIQQIFRGPAIAATTPVIAECVPVPLEIVAIINDCLFGESRQVVEEMPAVGAGAESDDGE